MFGHFYINAWTKCQRMTTLDWSIGGSRKPPIGQYMTSSTLTFLKAQQLSPKSTFTRHSVCRLHRPAGHSHMGPCQPPILAQSSKDELIESRGLNQFGRRSLKPLFCLANSTAFSEDSEHKKCAGCF